MMNVFNPSTLEDSKAKLGEILESERLLEVQVLVSANPLSPEEAIGSPQRRDFPIIEGRERVIEATVLGAKGHAFTDSPRSFCGTLKDILELPLNSNPHRAIFISTLNAVLRHLGEVEGTVHCKDEDPEKCAKEIAEFVLEKWGMVRVGLIGLNPAIADALISAFHAENVAITDLNRQNIGRERSSIEIRDGREENEWLIGQSEVVIVTGTTLVNGTFDHIIKSIRDRNKDYLIYGVTCAGICSLNGLDRICPYGRNQ